MSTKTKQQEKRPPAAAKSAARNKAELRTIPGKSKPSGTKSGGLMHKLLGGKAPQTVQQSIPYREMYRDGICRVNDRLYTKTVQFQDINYQLAQK